MAGRELKMLTLHLDRDEIRSDRKKDIAPSDINPLTMR